MMMLPSILIILLISSVSTQWTNAGLASISPTNKDPDLIYLHEFDMPKNAPHAHAIYDSIRFVTKNEIIGNKDSDTKGREFKLIHTKLDEMKRIDEKKKGTRLIIDNESEFVGSIDHSIV